MKGFTLALFGLVGITSALGGTYSVVGVEFLTNATTDASISSPSATDVTYSMGKSLSASGFETLLGYPSIQSEFRWRVRWSGAPGETHPAHISCKVAAYGHARASSQVQSNPVNGTYKAWVQLSDPFVSRISDVSATIIYFGMSDVDGSTTDEHHGYVYPGAGDDWTNVGGNVWESTADYEVNDLCSMEATFKPSTTTYGHSDATIDMGMTLRLIEVGGQSVASDF